MAKAKKTAKKIAAAKKQVKKLPKLTDADNVSAYMNDLKHPLKEGMEIVRSIINGVNKQINERIKWNAPSYHYKGLDMVTFNAWSPEKIHLVFHHPDIVRIKSSILIGDYPTRRMAYFTSTADVNKGKKELQRVMKELLQYIDKNS